jgi:mRNA-degrading endonuclease RelE of RelBE toxin-antitoxin system
MDNKDYEIRSDFAEGAEVLSSLSRENRDAVQSAIARLAKEPWPEQFSAKPLGGQTVKITVPVDDDEIVVLYDVDVYKSTIDIIRIKQRGTFQKAGEWLAGLVKFEPKGNP